MNCYARKKNNQAARRHSAQYLTPITRVGKALVNITS